MELSEAVKELRVIIAGGRDFDDFPKLMNSSIAIISEITKKKDELDKIRIISGTERGADKLGEQYAKVAGYELSKFAADWDNLGKRAGYIRNGEMAKFAVEDDNYGVLIAFWDGKSRGTKHMIDLANKYGLEIHIVKYKDQTNEIN